MQRVGYCYRQCLLPNGHHRFPYGNGEEHENISFDAKVWTAAGRCPKKVWWHVREQHGWIDSWSKHLTRCSYRTSNTYGTRKWYLVAFMMLFFVEKLDVTASRLFQREAGFQPWFLLINVFCLVQGNVYLTITGLYVVHIASRWEHATYIYLPPFSRTRQLQWYEKYCMGPVSPCTGVSLQ